MLPAHVAPDDMVDANIRLARGELAGRSWRRDVGTECPLMLQIVGRSCAIRDRKTAMEQGSSS